MTLLSLRSDKGYVVRDALSSTSSDAFFKIPFAYSKVFTHMKYVEYVPVGDMKLHV
jgi:tRNA splicing ligase